jgi:DNA-binding CsgD family transcriptional regulator/pimeloyl-ACP methyl ester carboxylesterase
MARQYCLIRFDNAGSGLSDDRAGDFSLDAIADEIAVVADALGLRRFALFGRITGGLPAIVFAARHPERVTDLVLWNSFADHRRHGGEARMKAVLDLAATDWQLFTESISQAALGWQDGPTARAWAEVLRTATSQETFLKYLKARTSWDVTDLLGGIRARTLVMYDLNNELVNAARDQELAAAIPDARLAAVRSDGGVPGDEAIAAIEAFLGDAEAPAGGLPELTRRENEVVAVLITGASNQQIARSLSISVNTVTRHLTHIFDKLGVTSRSEAIARILAASGDRIP